MEDGVDLKERMARSGTEGHQMVDADVWRPVGRNLLRRRHGGERLKYTATARQRERCNPDTVLTDTNASARGGT